MSNRASRPLMVALIAVLAVIPVASETAENEPQNREPLRQREAPCKQGFSLCVDPRIELLAVVQHFTPWAAGGHLKHSTIYKDDIDHYFHKFRDHPATVCLADLLDAGFSHDAPVNFILHHGDPPQLVQSGPYSEYLIGRAQGKDKLIALSQALREFARDSEFARFSQAHRSLYDVLVQEVDSLLRGKDYVAAIEKFYGESRHSYNIILAPVFADGGYGITKRTPSGCDIYCVLGPCSLKGQRTVFACPDYLESLVLHEWSHAFINPLVDQHFHLFKPSRHLFDPIKGMMTQQCYPTWRITLYEHLVRACGEIHLRAMLNGGFEKNRFLEYHQGKGFWYVSCIESLLYSYDIHRDEYTAFRDFIPVIAKSLGDIRIADLPATITTFRGPLSAVLPQSDRIYLVYPTAIDEELLERLKQELRQLGSFLSSGGIEPVLVSDAEAIEMNWQDKVAFVYGNPNDNLYLRHLRLSIPLRFAGNAMEFGGKRYTDEGIVLLSCMANPFNERLPFALCTASRTEDLIGVGIGSGPKMSSPREWNADYVIYHRDVILDAGHYSKDREQWSLVSSGGQH